MLQDWSEVLLLHSFPDPLFPQVVLFGGLPHRFVGVVTTGTGGVRITDPKVPFQCISAGLDDADLRGDSGGRRGGSLGGGAMGGGANGGAGGCGGGGEGGQ